MLRKATWDKDACEISAYDSNVHVMPVNQKRTIKSKKSRSKYSTDRHPSKLEWRVLNSIPVWINPSIRRAPSLSVIFSPYHRVGSIVIIIATDSNFSTRTVITRCVVVRLPLHSAHMDPAVISSDISLSSISPKLQLSVLSKTPSSAIPS